jgi:hypothetical protein
LRTLKEAPAGDEEIEGETELERDSTRARETDIEECRGREERESVKKSERENTMYIVVRARESTRGGVGQHKQRAIVRECDGSSREREEERDRER